MRHSPGRIKLHHSDFILKGFSVVLCASSVSSVFHKELNVPETHDPALRFVEEPYHVNDVENMLLRFRERGYVVLPRVFERESVDAFREQAEAALVKNDAGRWVMPARRASARCSPARSPTRP
jgi:hypothetical protein